MVSICGVALYDTSFASALVLVKTAAVISTNSALKRMVVAALSVLAVLNVLVVFMIISFVGCGVWFGWLFAADE